MDYDFINSHNSAFSKKNIITLLILVILALAIPLGVNLVQKTQVFLPGATGSEITFPNLKQNESGQYVTDSPTVNIKLFSPFGPPTSSLQTR
jgi:hypothetical protein